jgi:hypothetical protein
LAVVRPQLGADGQAALFLDFRVAQFLPPGLDREVGLALGDDFLRWIGVLDDEVAGVARHHHGLRRALCSLAHFDHIGDLNEMIVHPLPAVETSGASRLDDGLEIPVIRVAKHLGEVPAGPEFVARRIGAADILKGGDLPATFGRSGRAIFAALRFVAHGGAAVCDELNVALRFDDGEEVGAVGG